MTVLSLSLFVSLSLFLSSSSSFSLPLPSFRLYLNFWNVSRPSSLIHTIPGYFSLSLSLFCLKNRVESRTRSRERREDDGKREREKRVGGEDRERNVSFEAKLSSDGNSHEIGIQFIQPTPSGMFSLLFFSLSPSKFFLEENEGERGRKKRERKRRERERREKSEGERLLHPFRRSLVDDARASL